MIKVGVVASARAMRIGLREVLNGLPGLSVIAEATRLEDLAADEAEVVVAASPTALARFESCEALLLLSDDPEEARELVDLDLPAWGVLPVNASEEELLAAITALSEGLCVGSPGALRGLLAQKPSPNWLDENEAQVQALTERETEVLQLTAQGLANKQIAGRLGISEHTVKFHLSALYAKLGVSSRTEAVRSGARRGLVVL